MDDAVNLGGIGTWIGHEMTHGYDDEGRKYDADGNLHDWWSKADTKEFEARAKKIAEQYSEFEPLPGMKVNGMLTRGENIADLGSVSIAYEALRRRLDEGRTPRTKVDGFTPEQRFFLSYGQTNSNNIRDEDLRRKLTVDEHSPDKFRVIGPLANLPEFWEAFNIPPGSAMRRPEELRVEIW
jgi:predicted metalloendopeptidase